MSPRVMGDREQQTILSVRARNRAEHMLSLRCWRARRRLQPFLDGEVDARHAELIATHLRRCQDCELESRTLARIIEALHQLRPELDPAVHARLEAAVQDLTDRRQT